MLAAGVLFGGRIEYSHLRPGDLVNNRDMSPVDLARIQFGMTSIYHFLFVPVTIGLAFLTALMQTAWYRKGNPEHLRLTKFFGTLLVINVVIGVVTGLVQEFQFGMNWSTYSRFVGDVFGAPLAMEGLAAFFLESVFLGLWIFGWNRLRPGVHLTTIWLVAIGGPLSAAFILAANSWMQRPVGYQIANGRAELTDIWAVLTNTVFVWAFIHVVLAALVTGGVIMLAVSAWQIRRGTHSDIFLRAAKLSMVVLLPAVLLNLLVGSQLGVVETTYQPMKIAAAEAQWNTCQPCSFSLFQIGGGNNDQTPTQIIEIPHLLSVLATLTWNGQVVGLNELQAQYQQQYGPGYYVPNVFVQYWSMRVMAYLAVVVFLVAAWGVWLWWRKKIPASKWFLRFAIWTAPLPFLINTAGWMLTENGRQPWIVQGLQLTTDGVSQSVNTTSIVISISMFAVVYLVLAIVAIALMLRYARKELAPEPGPAEESHELEFTY
jgi:cytochrome d ubiquinol oxidase subunit I